MRKLIVAAAAVLLLVVGGVEVAMRPTPGERTLLVGLFAAAAATTVLVGWAARRAMRRLPTLQASVLLPPVAALAVTAVVVTVAALTMFLSSHDLQLLVFALVLGVSLGSLLGVTLAGPLSSDLRRIADVARRVAEGDLTVSTDVERADEVGRVATAIDSMVGKLAEAEKARRRDEESRRRFLTAIGHDLRTPLTSLQAAVEALEDGVAPDPGRYLRSMGADLRVLRDLVDDLFVLARIEAGDLRLRPVPVDLAELSDEVLEGMRPLAAQRRVELVLANESPLTVEADPQAVARVIRNLVDNAVRHAPDGSLVRVEASRQEVGAVLRVVDEGPGFGDAFLAGIRPDGTGSGLGLPIARGLVEAHGGTIWIEEGPGGKVAFRLPTVVGAA